MARVQILSTLAALFIIAPTLCLQKEHFKKDEVKIVEIEDATFFDSVYIETHDFLVLVIPDSCKECEGLMKEFETNKEKIAEEFPDLLIGYIHGRLNNNFLVRRAMDVNTRPSSIIAKAFVKNRLIAYEGRINVKRLTKWVRGILEESLMDNRLPPSGIIQVNPSMLHYLSKETEDETSVLLAPATNFLKNKNFATSLEKAREHFEKNGLSLFIGLVEEEMPMLEVGGFDKKSQSQNLVFLQKTHSGALFISVKEETEDEVISEKNIIEWVKLNSVPEMTRIEKKAELAALIKDKRKDYMILGYTLPGNATRISSIAKTVGDLARKIKDLLISGHSKSFTEIIFERMQFALTTNTMIANKFGFEDEKEAVVIIFNDEDTATAQNPTKVFTVLGKSGQDENEPMEIEPMIELMNDYLGLELLEKMEKDEL